MNTSICMKELAIQHVIYMRLNNLGVPKYERHIVEQHIPSTASRYYRGRARDKIEEIPNCYVALKAKLASSWDFFGNLIKKRILNILTFER